VEVNAKLLAHLRTDLFLRPEYDGQLNLTLGGYADNVRRFFNATTVNESAPDVRAAALTAAAQLLTVATDTQEQFLNLFCLGQLPMIPGDATTLLPYDVYGAGEELARHGYLTKGKGKDSTVRFCPSAAMSRAWDESSRAAKPERKCVEIGLDTVQGTRASGSGATGGQRH
jgi:hypothetical protein